MDLDTLKLVGGSVGAVFAGGGVWSVLKARIVAKNSPPAQIAASQADLVSALNAQTKILLAESAKDRRQLKHRIDQQATELKEVKSKVADCEERHDNCESNLAEVRAQIDKLMADNPALPGYVFGSKEDRKSVV